MLIQPIIAATPARAAPRPAALKIAAGVLFLLFAALVLPPYWALIALWLSVTGIAAAAARAARAAYDCLIFAGEAIVGR